MCEQNIPLERIAVVADRKQVEFHGSEVLMKDQMEYRLALYDQMAQLDKLIETVAVLLIFTTVFLLYVICGPTVAVVSAVALTAVMVTRHKQFRQIEQRRRMKITRVFSRGTHKE